MSRWLVVFALLAAIASPASAASSIVTNASLRWTYCGADVWSASGFHTVVIDFLEPDDLGGTLNLEAALYKCPFDLEVAATQTSALLDGLVASLRTTTSGVSLHCRKKIRSWAMGKILKSGPRAVDEFSTACEEQPCGGSA